MSIKDWSHSLRPREKLLSRGSGSLSDAELLALLFGSGCSGHSAVDLAQALLVEMGGLRAVLESSPEQLKRRRGLGPARVALLQAVSELARRSLRSELEQRPALSSPEHAGNYLSALLRHRKREVFTLLLLDNQHRVLGCEELFEGTIDQAAVYPREVLRKVFDHNAAAVILAHNHPSGHAQPSQADITLTRNLQNGLKTIDVRVLDHLIIGSDSVVSMAELGLLQ